LRRPLFRLIDSTHVLGRWKREERCIEFARTLLTNHSWGVIVEVLLHEMAHQYVDEVLGAGDERAHGPLFDQVCRKFRIDARAQGVPAAGDDATRTAILDKVSKLLALATSPNPHEAQSAMNAARRLMLKHNLERLEAERARGYVWKQLGPTLKRVEIHRGMASVILERHFFVTGIWTSVWDARTRERGSVLEVCGTPANVEFAAYVYSFLVHTAEGLWAMHRRANPGGGLTARRSFLRGVMQGFGEKLEAESRRDGEAGLVWVGDPALQDYFRRRHPHVSRRPSYGRHDPDAHASGREAGQRLVIHKPIESASAASRGMLLPRG
jgi:hypothetical protein